MYLVIVIKLKTKVSELKLIHSLVRVNELFIFNCCFLTAYWFCENFVLKNRLRLNNFISQM